MSLNDEIPEAGDRGRDPLFVTTRWTVVVSAGRRSSPDAAAALEELCRTYWYPLYSYVRRQGASREEAEDRVQGFFERFLARNYLGELDRERGRFRAYLLACLKHYLANEHDRATRGKRGGGQVPLSLDWSQADERFRIEVASPEMPPDQCFDRQWALALLERVLIRLRRECAESGREALFQQVSGFLGGTAEAGSYGDAATALGMEEGALRVAVHRLRKRYRDLLREEITQTLLDPGQVEAELRSLQASLLG
jgi:RNA polymerase sigma-70 factor (ECF subfamily)